MRPVDRVDDPPEETAGVRSHVRSIERQHHQFA
jgi:hypothetical protein